MTTTNECRHNAEICLMLARDTKEIFAKMALIELAGEFRILAEDLERRLRGDQPPLSGPGGMLV
jgi:hypothetical protein